jgi:hypothetical protein
MQHSPPGGQIHASTALLGESSIEAAKARVGSMRDLLARHAHHVRGRMVRCPFPDHDDRHPSASLYVAADGDERVHCHSCGRDEDTLGLARVFGEPQPSPPGAAPRRARRRASRPDPETRALVQVLARRASWPFELAAAKRLALLEGPAVHLEVLRNWRYLADRGDVRLIVQTSALIRGVAMLRFCSARSVENPRSIEYAIRRLIEEVEGGP